jgi:hypothetical protein
MIHSIGSGHPAIKIGQRTAINEFNIRASGGEIDRG